MPTETNVSDMYVSAKDLVDITGYSREGIRKAVSRNNLNFIGSEKKRYYSTDEIKKKSVFDKYYVEIEKHSIPKDQIPIKYIKDIKTDPWLLPPSDTGQVENPKPVSNNLIVEKIEKDIKQNDINKESEDNPMRSTKKSDDEEEDNDEYYSEDEDEDLPAVNSKNKREPKGKGSDADQEFTSVEAQALADQYNVAVRDVIDYLNSVEGKKGQKYEAAKDHFDRVRLEQENQRLRSFFSMNIPPATVSSPDNHKKSDDNVFDNNGYDADIKYQRQVAAAWGPFLMMRNLSPAQNDDAIKREIEELKESNKDLKNLLYSFLSGNQGKPKNDDPIDNMTRFLGLFKGIKDVLSESEAERQKKIEEETKQKEIEANKEKVSKLIEAIQNYSPNSEPESKFEPSVPVYRAVNNNNIDRPVKVLNKKFKDKFSKN